MKNFTALRALVVTLIVALTSTISSAQYVRQTQQGNIMSGINAGTCGEASYGSGADGCFYRVGPGQYGFSNGIGPVASFVPISPNIFLNAPGAASLATATTGGSIAAGTYRVAFTLLTAMGGETPIGTDSSSTQATTGATSTLTVTAPSSVPGAVGYRVYISPAAGAANTEVLQPLSTTVCAGAFTVGGGNTVCPFGANAVFTSLVSTGYAGPALSGAVNTAGLVNLTAGPQTAITTVTTAQTLGSWGLAAGAMNVLGKKIKIKGELMFSNGVTTPAITLSVKIGSSISPVSIVGANNANSNTNSPLYFEAEIETTTIGTSGVDESHGRFCETVAAAWSSGTAVACYIDGATAASSAYDHTVANTLALNIAATAALTSVTLRDVSIEFISPQGN